MQLTTILAIFFAISTDLIDSDIFRSLPVWRVFVFFAGVVVLEWSLVRWLSRVLLARTERSERQDRRVSLLPGRIDFFTRLLVLSAYSVFVIYGGWGALVILKLGLQRVEWVLAGEVMMVLPFVVFEWVRLRCYYPVNRAIREQLMMGQLAEGMAARPVWSLRQYLSFQFRYGILIVLIPILMIVALKDLVELISVKLMAVSDETAWHNWVGGISGAVIFAGAVGLFIVSPMLLRYVWLTRMLPDGILRQKLERFCRLLGLRYRDVLLWDTYGAVGNAAMMGLLGRFRYVLMSDALIENLPDREILAVFGHEAGHVQGKHVLFLGMFVFGYSLVAGLVLELFRLGLGSWGEAAGWLQSYEGLMYSAAGVVFSAGWIVLFGWVSHRFEHQSDLLGAMAIDLYDRTAGGEQVHDGEPGTVRSLLRQGQLSAAGSEAMTHALYRIAMINGIALSQRSWRHPSIQRRLEFLRRLVHNDILVKRFESVIFRIKFFILIGLAAGAAGWLCLVLYENA